MGVDAGPRLHALTSTAPFRKSKSKSVTHTQTHVVFIVIVCYPSTV